MAQLGLTELNVTNSVVTSLAGSSQTAPTFWLDPEERRVLSHRGADAGIPGRYAVAVWKTCRSPRHVRHCRCWAAWARSRASNRAPWSRTTTSCRRSISTPRRRIAIWAASQAMSANLIDSHGEGCSQRRDRHVARTGRHDEHGLLRPRSSACSRRDRAHLHADRRELSSPGSTRSSSSPRCPAALAGIVWMLFATGHDAVRARAHRRHHVHGRGDGELDPGRQLRARAARRNRQCRRWLPSKPASRAFVPC